MGAARRRRSTGLIAYGSWRWKVLMLRCAWLSRRTSDDAVS